MTTTGGCLCGEVRFEVDRFAGTVAHCHCSMCRRFHGAAFATLATVPVDAFRWMSGEALLAGYEAENGTVRTFCSRCGSSLTFATPKANGASIEVALGALDDDPPIEPDAHIFTEAAPAWTLETDRLARHARHREPPG